MYLIKHLGNMEKYKGEIKAPQPLSTKIGPVNMLTNFFPAVFIPDVGLCSLDGLASLLVRFIVLVK